MKEYQVELPIDLKNNLKNIESLCCELSIQAGLKIMEVYENKSLFENVEYKSDKSPLTQADKLANDVIVQKLKQEYPTYAILSEEEKDDLNRLNNDLCFVVDPLDGTKEFIKRNGQFTVNIGLSYKNVSILGVIYVPATGELFYASKDNGSHYKAPNAQPVKINVSNCEDLSKVKLVMSSSHGCAEMDEIINKYNFNNFVKMGSSLKGCLIAKGDAEIYYRHNPTCEWDTCAMQCIATEAGAFVAQMDNTPLLYNRKNTLNDKGFYIINSMKNRV